MNYSKFKIQYQNKFLKFICENSYNFPILSILTSQGTRVKANHAIRLNILSLVLVHFACVQLSVPVQNCSYFDLVPDMLALCQIRIQCTWFARHV